MGVERPLIRPGLDPRYPSTQGITTLYPLVSGSEYCRLVAIGYGAKGLDAMEAALRIPATSHVLIGIAHWDQVPGLRNRVPLGLARY